MSSNDGKQYGLILPKSKQNPSAQFSAKKDAKKASVFGDESSSNSDNKTSNNNKNMRFGEGVVVDILPNAGRS